MTPTFENIYLLGFMGCGKSTLARMLAGDLGWHVVDSDTEIELRAGMTVSRIFATKGEAWFREQELEVLQEIAMRDKCVVALGGGAVLREEVWSLLRPSGTSIYLQRSPEKLYQHLRFVTDRPVLQRAEDGDVEAYIKTLLEERQAWYERADHALICEDSWDKDETFSHLRDLVRGFQQT